MDGTDIALVVANIALVIATAWYVILTQRMLTEMRGANRPRISVELDATAERNNLVLVIANRGVEAALDVRFEISKDFLNRGPLSVLDYVFAITHGFPCIPPGKEYRFPLHFRGGNLVGGDDLRACLGVSYRWRSEKMPYKEKWTLDASPVLWMNGKGVLDPTRVMAWEIGALRTSLEDRNHHLDRMAGARKFCPLCQERIPKAATVCSHCLRDLPATESVETSNGLDMIE